MIHVHCFVILSHEHLEYIFFILTCYLEFFLHMRKVFMSAYQNSKEKNKLKYLDEDQIQNEIVIIANFEMLKRQFCNVPKRNEINIHITACISLT